MDEKTLEPFDGNRQHSILPIFENILKQNKKLYAIYLGYGNGDFYELINLDIDKKLRQQYKAKNTDQWLLVTIIDQNTSRIKYLELLDKNLAITSEKTETTQYDPRKRPWYQKASASKAVIKTEPYDFSNIEAKGVTYATKVKGSENVIAVDVLLNSLSETLVDKKLTPSMESYLFNDKGVIIASSSSDDKNFEQLFKNTDPTIDSSKNLSIDGTRYMVETIPIASEYDNKEYLGIAAPLSEVMEPYKEKLNLTLIFGIAALILTFPLVWYTASIIVNPIANLRKESDKVKTRKFDDVKLVQTNVLELSELSHSLFLMSKAIHKHQQTLEEKIQERTQTISQLLADMKDSVEYALLIQKSLVADKEDIKKAFPQSFVIWEPKDVVAGDIYFFENLGQDQYLLVCVDCTGHGVPGAFLTVAVKSIQKELIHKLKILKTPMTPAEMMHYFDKELKKLIKVEDGQTWHAGFDGGILYINREMGMFTYAGAQTPLFYTQDGKIQVLKSDKASVGYSGTRSEPTFHDHTVAIEKGMNLVLTTDGFLDQTGGPKGFSYGKKRFVKLLEKLHEEPLDLQGKLILEEYYAYMKDSSRKDDLTVIGLKLI